MDKLVFNTPEEAVTNLNTGDRDHDLGVVNAILSGNVQIGEKQPEENIEAEVSNNNIQQDVHEEVSPDPIASELERQIKYNEFIEKQKKDESERYLATLKEKELAIDRERKAKEEVEKRLKMLEENRSQLQTKNETDNNSDNEDDAFVSDYAKKTREMVDEIKRSVERSPLTDKDTIDRINNLVSEFESEKSARQKRDKEEAIKKQEQKMFDSIRGLQVSVSDLKTSKDIKELDEEYRTFRKNLATVTRAQTVGDLEKAIEDYYNNGETKRLADTVGIKPMEEYKKYVDICELIDFKDGMQYDSKNGKMIPITDDDGNQIRYRSLEEAYQVKNYHTNLENARIKSYREVNNKLTQFKNAPVTIPIEKTDEFSTNFSTEKIHELLNTNPKEWERNPDLRGQVEAVYAKMGLSMPKYKGK